MIWRRLTSPQAQLRRLMRANPVTRPAALTTAAVLAAAALTAQATAAPTQYLLLDGGTFTAYSSLEECAAALKAAGRGNCVSAGQAAAPQAAQPNAQDADELRVQREKAQRQYEEQERTRLRAQREEAQRQREQAQREYEYQLERYKQALRDAERAQREGHEVWCNRLSQQCSMNWSGSACRNYEANCAD